MAVYWVSGAALFWRRYYGRARVAKMVLLGAGGPKCAALAMAGVAAVMATHTKYASRTTTYGRPRSVAATVLFSACNGAVETLWFLASFDLGRRFADSFNAPAVVSFCAGYVTHVRARARACERSRAGVHERVCACAHAFSDA